MLSSFTVAQEVPSVIDDVSRAMQTNVTFCLIHLLFVSHLGGSQQYVGIASFSILIWDHIVTFPTEVEFIWNGKKGTIAYLFLLNRYLTPLGFVGNAIAYLSPIWTYERRSKFIKYGGAMTMIGIEVVAIMMLIRIHALYSKQKWIVGGLAFLLLCQTIMNAWLLTKGEAVVHNPYSGVRSCTMIFDPAISKIAASSAWMPLLYDTVVLVLTLHWALPELRGRNMSFIMKRLLKDGLIYYTVIFTITLVLTIVTIAAPPGLKNITAQLELLLTVTMMSRITLSLKKSGGKQEASVYILDGDGILHHLCINESFSFHVQRLWPALKSACV